MKKFIAIASILVLLFAGGVVAWFYVVDPKLSAKIDFQQTDSTPVTITIPVGGDQYVDLLIDGINTELQETNNLTVWQFNDARVMRTATDVSGHDYFDGVTYSSSNQVSKKFGDYFVTVTSSTKNVLVSAECMRTLKPRTGESYELRPETEKKELPSLQLPEEYVEENGWKLPTFVEYKSSDDMSYYSGDWYFNYNFRYMKFTDAVSEAVTRACTLGSGSVDWWFSDDVVFVVKSGNEYVCVNQRDYTSCYFISSNDLSYILLNLN